MFPDCPSQSSIWAVVIFQEAAFLVALLNRQITRTS